MLQLLLNLKALIAVASIYATILRDGYPIPITPHLISLACRLPRNGMHWRSCQSFALSFAGIYPPRSPPSEVALTCYANAPDSQCFFHDTVAQNTLVPTLFRSNAIDQFLSTRNYMRQLRYSLEPPKLCPPIETILDHTKLYTSLWSGTLSS